MPLTRLGKSAAFAPIILLILLVLAAAAWVIELWRSQDYLQAQVELQTKELDRELDQLAILPRLLSLDPRMANALIGENQRAVAIANEALATTKIQSGVSFAFLMNTDGDTIASSNWNDAISFVGRNYQFRPYFSDALQGQQATFFAVGATTGVPGYFIAEAVRINNRVIGVIVVKMELDQLLQGWSENSFTSLLVDELGVVILSTKTELLYTPTATLDTDVRQTIEDDRRYQLNTTTQLQSLARSGWSDRFWRLSNDIKSTLYTASAGSLSSENWILLNVLPLSVIARGALPYFAILSSLLVIGYLVIRSYRQRRVISLTRERHAALLESEVKQRTSELESAQQALIAQANFAMLGRMSAAINHEINQPLASLRFNLATLRQIIDNPDPASNDLRETIIASDRTTKRIGRVVETLRSVARQGNNDLNQVGVSQLVVDVGNIVQRERPVAANALTIDNSISTRAGSTAAVYVRGNEILLQQALLNLLYNAMDAVLDASDASVLLYSIQQGHTAIIGIQDNGGGIEPSLVEHLFQPFQSELSHRKGLGLGLTLAKQIVEDHNGSLKYEPVASGGSHFSIHLPVHHRPTTY